jgi:hypothetical protein
MTPRPIDPSSAPAPDTAWPRPQETVPKAAPAPGGRHLPEAAPGPGAGFRFAEGLGSPEWQPEP